MQHFTQSMQPHGAPRGQSHNHVELTTDRFNVAPKRREIHVGLPLDLGDRWLFDLQRCGNIGLRLASGLAKLSQAFDLIVELSIPGVDSLAPSFRQGVKYFN
jgi:hypothetical protein